MALLTNCRVMVIKESMTYKLHCKSCKIKYSVKCIFHHSEYQVLQRQLVYNKKLA